MTKEFNTVGDLIKKLQQLDPSLPLIKEHDTWMYPLDFEDTVKVAYYRQEPVSGWIDMRDSEHDFQLDGTSLKCVRM